MKYLIPFLLIPVLAFGQTTIQPLTQSNIESAITDDAGFRTAIGAPATGDVPTTAGDVGALPATLTGASAPVDNVTDATAVGQRYRAGATAPYTWYRAITAGAGTSTWEEDGGGGTVDNASVATAVATDPQNIRASLQMRRVENRPGRLFALAEKLISGGANNALPQIRIATIRDSTGQRFARPYWYGKYGIGGIVARPTDYLGSAYDWVTHASGTSIVAGQFSEDITGNYWSVPTSGTVTYLAMPAQTTNAEVQYIKANGGGTFKLQYAVGSSNTYADLYSQSTGTLNGTTTVTGLSSGIVSELQAGMSVAGTNIPGGTTIASVDSTTQITLSASATGSGSVTLTFTNKTYNTNNGGAQETVMIRPFIENFGAGQGFCRFYKLRAVGVSGTSKITAIGTVLNPTSYGSRPRGVVTMDWGQGGTTMANWVAMDATVFQNALAAYAPDIIFIRDWEPISTWSADVTTNFPTLITRIRAALPRVAIVVVGSHPTGENASCEDPFYEHPMDVWLKNYCVQNDIEFLDVRKYFPSRATMINMGWQGAGDEVHLGQTSAEWFLDSLIADRLPMLAGAQPWDWKIGGAALVTPPLQNVTAIQNSNGQLVLSGFSSDTRPFFSLSASDGNSNGNFPTLQTGIGRLRSDTSYFWHDGRLGLYSGGNLGAVVGNGRLWVGTGASSTEYGLQKQINGGAVIQAPASNLPSGIFGGVSGQSVDIMQFNTGMSSTTDGTTVSGVTKDAILYHGSFTTTQRDALTSPKAGSVILNTTTGKLNFYTGSAWEAVTSAP